MQFGLRILHLSDLAQGCLRKEDLLPPLPCQDLAQGCFRKEGVLTPVPPKDVREGGPALNLRHTPLQDSESHQGQEPTVIPSEESAFGSHNFPRADGRGRNLFQEFMASLPRPISATAVRSPPRTRTPSPDIFLELYSHTRHPFDFRTHLTILPSWARKVEKKSQGECVICYGEDRHLQIKYKSFGTIKVCCHCVVDVYQSINSCPVCRFRGEF